MRRGVARVALVLLVAAASRADVQPVVRAEVAPETVAVGESVTLTVTVLVPTWFPRPPVFPSFELANTVTRLPPNSSYPTSERIEGETWSGIVHKYRIHPLAAGRYRLGGETLHVTWARPGSEPVEADAPVPEVAFRSAVPQGAEGLDPYVAGRSLRLTRGVEGDLEGLAVGSAVVLRYTAELEGLPSLFLPPLAPEIDAQGLSVHAGRPEVEDGPPARRREEVTLVFEGGGTFTVPPVELAWWDTEAQEVRTAVAEGLTLSVAGPPATPRGALEPESGWRRLALGAALVLLGVGALARGLPGLRARARRAAERRRRSEGHAFDQLQRALRSGAPDVAYHALVAWTGRLDPPTEPRAFARESGDASLKEAVDGLSGAVYGGRAGPDALRGLRDGLAAARRRRRPRPRVGRASGLPPLNP